jgi:ribonuclease H-related protein
MATTRKIYAALFPDGTRRFFREWSECQKAVHGVKDVHFKGFPSREDAELWLSRISDKLESADAAGGLPASQRPDELHIYVDGAYRPGCKKAGWAWVAVRDGLKIAEDSGVTGADALSRNIDGELEAAAQAMEWAAAAGQRAVLFHDYAGIAMWASGAWKVKAPVSKAYVERIRELKSAFTFKKVAAHAGVEWNEYADKLAEGAITRFQRPGDREKAG